ncbi:MAG TPA: 23S rRNA (adenine(2503)-C(2))-methyltransferase RlmN [Tepidisphaeraceae bacterium]
MALAEYDVSSLEALFARWGFARGNARRLLRRFYDCGGERVEEGLISPRLAERLVGEVGLRSTAVVTRREAGDGTVKLLVGLANGRQKAKGKRQKEDDAGTGLATAGAECVLMPSHRGDRAAGCVSSQVGCAMGCDFCASTKAGVERDLTSGEIVEQFLWLRGEALRMGRRLQTVVFMGMGEPLLNYENVVGAIRRIAGQELGALGWRNVTVSTVGIVPGIERLRADELGVQLAVSLHAPDDATRAAIVPTGRRYRVDEILAAAARYQAASGRVVNVEYTMLEGVNDSDGQAALLAERVVGLGMHVNLIPYNWIGPGVSGRVYRRPAVERMERFLEILTAGGVVAHVRRTRGDEIEGTCGQLRERVSLGDGKE